MATTNDIPGILKQINNIFRKKDKNKTLDKRSLMEQAKSVLRQIDIPKNTFLGYQTFSICHDDVPLSNRLRCLHIKIGEKKNEPANKDFDQLLTEAQKGKYYDSVMFTFDDYEWYGIDEIFIHENELQALVNQMPKVLNLIKDKLENPERRNEACNQENKRHYMRRQLMTNERKAWADFEKTLDTKTSYSHWCEKGGSDFSENLKKENARKLKEIYDTNTEEDEIPERVYY